MKRRIAFIAILLLTACKPPIALKVFTDSTCEPPCWNQITPNDTDTATAQSVLQNLTILDRTNSHNADALVEDNILRLYRIFSDGGELLVDTKDNMVIGIGMRRHASADNETIEDIVTRFGPPENVYAGYLGPEDVKLVIDLMYPTKGVMFTVYDRPRNPSLTGDDKIEATMPVLDAIYLTPGTARSLLKESGIGENRIDCILQHMQPWTGYGTLKLPPPLSGCRTV